MIYRKKLKIIIKIKKYLYVAPGTYSPEKVKLDKSPAYTILGKPHPDKPNYNPGNVIIKCLLKI